MRVQMALMSTVTSPCECIITQCNPTRHMRRQHMPAYILQGFWGFPALLLVILETLFLNHFSAGLPWGSLAAGSPGGLRSSPERCGGLIHSEMWLSILNCWHFLIATVAHFLGNTLPLVLVRWECRWATGSSWRHPCSLQGRCTKWLLKVSSNPKHSISLWFYVHIQVF